MSYMEWWETKAFDSTLGRDGVKRLSAQGARDVCNVMFPGDVHKSECCAKDLQGVTCDALDDECYGSTMKYKSGNYTACAAKKAASTTMSHVGSFFANKHGERAKEFHRLFS